MRKFGWIIIFFIGLPAYAQQNFASISFGASLPMGEYGKTGDLASNGYARSGGAIKFDAGFFPVSYFGIGGSFSFGSNYAIRDSLLQDMVAYIEQNASSIIDIPPDADIQYGSGFWNYINVFLGPHFSIRASQRLYFDIRALAGVTILRQPDQELYIAFDGTEIFTTTSGSKATFGFTAGGGLRFKLNQNLSLKLGVDYSQSRAKSVYNFGLFSPVAADIPPINADFFVRTLELSVGLAYSF